MGLRPCSRCALAVGGGLSSETDFPGQRKTLEPVYPLVGGLAPGTGGTPSCGLSRRQAKETPAGFPAGVKVTHDVGSADVGDSLTAYKFRFDTPPTCYFGCFDNG